MNLRAAAQWLLFIAKYIVLFVFLGLYQPEVNFTVIRTHTQAAVLSLLDSTLVILTASMA